jgi:uncharacterized protein
VIDLKEKDGAVIFNVRVIPNSSLNEIIGEFDGALKIKIAVPPVGGAANAELVKILSKKLGIPKNAVEIIGGHSSKNKQVKIQISDRLVLEKLL